MTDTPISPDWITQGEAAKELGMTEGGLRYWIRRLRDKYGVEFSSTQIGHMIYYRRTEVDNICAEIEKYSKRKKSAREE